MSVSQSVNHSIHPAHQFGKVRLRILLFYGVVCWSIYLVHVLCMYGDGESLCSAKNWLYFSETCGRDPSAAAMFQVVPNTADPSSVIILRPLSIGY